MCNIFAGSLLAPSRLPFRTAETLSRVPAKLWAVEHVPAAELRGAPANCLVVIVSFSEVLLHLGADYPPIHEIQRVRTSTGFLVEGMPLRVFCSGHQMADVREPRPGFFRQYISTETYVVSEQRYRRIDKAKRRDREELSREGRRVVAVQTEFPSSRSLLRILQKGKPYPWHLDSAILHIEDPLKGANPNGLRIAEDTVSVVPGSTGVALGYGEYREAEDGEVRVNEGRPLLYSAYTAPMCGHMFAEDAHALCMPFVACAGFSGGPVLVPTAAIRRPSRVWRMLADIVARPNPIAGRKDGRIPLPGRVHEELDDGDREFHREDAREPFPSGGHGHLNPDMTGLNVRFH